MTVDPSVTHPSFLDVEVDGVHVHVATAGPEDGPLVVLLHGFPEFWYGWRKQIPALAAAGFRVVAPDQRGYGLSDKPPRIADYDLDELAGDVLGLIAAFDRERAHVVGHDWGAAVAWHLGIHAPDRIDRLGILNVPHPAAFSRALRELPRQWLRSWYIAFFQLPRIPEMVLSARDHRVLRDALARTSRPGTFTSDDLARYAEMWSQPEAVRAMIDWYRAPRLAVWARRSRHGKDGRVRVPTLILWGEGDAFLSPVLARWSLERCEDGRLERLPDATHWLHHEEPERVNDLLRAFLTSA